MKNTLVIAVLLLGYTPQIANAAGEHEKDYRIKTQEQVREMYNSHLDPGGTEQLLREMYQHNFRLENMLQIQSMIRSAYAEHLPTEPLMAKVHEGLAKDITDGTIVKAVERVQNRYEHAYRQVERQNWEENEQQDLAELLAETYAAGLQQEDCERIMAELKIRSRYMGSEDALRLSLATFTAARVMAHRNVDSDTITTVLTNAIQNSYQEQDMIALQQAFRNRVRFGSSQIVAQQFSKEVRQGVEAGRLGDGLMHRHGAFADRGNESTGGDQQGAAGEGASTGEGASSGGSNSAAGNGSGGSVGAGSGDNSGKSGSGQGGSGSTGNSGNGSEGHGDSNSGSGNQGGTTGGTGKGSR